MRIFCAVRHANDSKQFYGGLWSANFYPALRELGHEIIESQTDLQPTSRFMTVAGEFTREELEMRARTTESILNEISAAQRSAPVDLFLSYFYNAHFDPAGFDTVRRLEIPSVNFYCNSIYQFQLVQAVAAKVDYSWHAERDARAAYLAAGANPVWVQMGADPNVYRPAPDAVRSPKACFVGQRYADRDRWMAALIRAEVHVDIYGPGWGASSSETPAPPSANETAVYLGRKQPQPQTLASYAAAFRQSTRRQGWIRGAFRTTTQLRYRNETRRLAPIFAAYAKGAVPFERIAEVFSNYELCLNFSNVWGDGAPGSRLIPHVRLRDFEAPMSRACYLTGYSDELNEFYDLGREIDTYGNPGELIDKTRFYLSHPGSAEKLREAAYQRAVRSHTWRHRFQELFQKIGLTNRRDG